jgi:5'-3' exonuclease
MSKTFQQVSEQENCLMIVDALNLAFRWKHSGATDFAEDYKRTIESLKKSYKAKWVVVAADQGSSSYRKSIYPEYKQNRKDKFAEQTDAEKAAFEMFFEDYQASLDLIRATTYYPVIQFKQTEADDIAAYITSIRNLLPAVDHIWLISSDKDWDLLIDDNTSRFSYVTRKEITANNWHTHYDFPHEHYISVKCLMGDTGDNVLGVEGIGPKRAQQLVEQYGSALDIVAELPIESKLKYIKTLNQSGDRILLNYQLMDLVTFCRDALGENTTEIDQILNQYVKL